MQIPKTDSPLVVSGEQIAALLVQLNIHAPQQILDAQFVMPKTDWVETVFADALTSLVRQLDYVYKAEARDCDDFARFAAWYMGYLHSRMADAEGKAIAMGEFGYYEPNIGVWGGYHAIVFTVDIKPDRSGFELRFFEPQPTATDYRITKVCMRQRQLTPDDIGSCIYLRL